MLQAPQGRLVFWVEDVEAWPKFPGVEPIWAVTGVGNDVARTHSQSSKHRQQHSVLPIPPGPSYQLQSQVHSTPLQYKPQFKKGFPSTFPGHHLSFKRHIIDEAMITCGLQDSEPRSSRDQKVDNSDSEQGPVKQTRIWEIWQDSSVRLLRPHLSHLAMSNPSSDPI